MKRLAFVLLLLAGNAWAQPPQEVTPEGNISLTVGQAKVFRFDDPLARIDVTRPGIVEATKQSDRQIMLSGIAPGEVRMFVVSPDGQRMYDAVITVVADRFLSGGVR